MEDVSVILYYSHYKAVKNLPQNEKGRLLDLIFEYAATGEVSFTVTESESLKMAFNFIRIQIDLDKRKYIEKCERNKTNARKRWERTDANATERNNNDNNNNNENENEKDNKYDNGNSVGNNPTRCNKKNNEKKEETKLNLTKEYKQQCKDIVKRFNEIVLNTNGCTIKPVRVLLTDLNQKRYERLTELLKAFNNEQIYETFKYIAQSEYLNGRGERKRPADFDWIIKKDNFVKAFERNL